MKPIVELFVEPLNRHVRFLLDTGSDVSLISDSLCGTGLDLRTYGHSVASISGDCIGIRGIASFSLLIDNSHYKWNIIVASWDASSGFDGVLGYDFLKSFPDMMWFLFKTANNAISLSDRRSEVCEITENPNEVDSDESDSSFVAPPVSPELSPPSFVASEYEDIVEEFSELFASVIKKSKCGAHDIILTSDKPICTPPRRLPLCYVNEVESMLQDYERQGIIVRSESPYCSPTVIVPKKNGKLRLCCDYRRLNKITIQNKHPIPTFEEIRDCLQGSRVFSKFDLRSGYWQLKLTNSAMEKTAFSPGPQFGLWEWTVLPFGLTNAPSKFQSTMENIFRELPYVKCFIDDIIVHSPDMDSHRQHLKHFLQRCSDLQLTLNGEKSCIGVNEVEMMGHIIGHNTVRMSPSKIETIQNWPEPQNKKQLMSFLGCCNYTSRFVENYVDMVAPLYDLTKKNVKFQWSDDLKKVFQKLKDEFSKNVYLKIPDPSEKFWVYTDASNVGISGVLMQNDRPVEFCGRKLSESERKYSTIQRECLAIVYTLKKFRHYLLGVPFELRSDHKPLVWLLDQHLDGMLGRWSLMLQEYNFQLQHIKGFDNVLADSISRQHTNSILINPEIMDIELKEEQDKDPVISQIKTIIKENGTFKLENVTPSLNKRWKQIFSQLVIEDDILYRISKQTPFDSPIKCRIIPESMQKKIIERHHDPPICGHLGLEKTLARLERNVYWPGMKLTVLNYVSSCISCQQVKAKAIKSPIQYFTSSATYPGELVTADVLKLPSDQGFNAILLVVDSFSKFPIAYKLRNETAQTISKHFLHYFTHFGIPQALLTDQGTNFESSLVQNLCKYFGVKKLRTSPYHPETDGQTERLNRTILEMLRHYSEDGKWVDYIDLVLMAYRTSVQSSTGQSPALLFLGREIREAPVFEGDNNGLVVPSEEEWAEILDSVECKKAEIKRQNLSCDYFHPGDIVMIRKHVRSKLQPTFDPDWRVTNVGHKCVTVQKNNLTKTINFDDCVLQK